MQLLVIGIITSLLSYYTHKFIMERITEFKISKYVDNEGVGYKTLNEREKYLLSTEAREYGNLNDLNIALESIKFHKNELTNIKLFGFIKKGKKYYSSLSYVKILVPDVARKLLKKYKVTSLSIEDELKNGYQIIAKHLEDGSILKPVIVSSKVHKGYGESLFTEITYSIGVINQGKVWNYTRTLTQESEETDAFKDCVVSEKQYTLSQFGDFQELGIK